MQTPPPDGPGVYEWFRLMLVEVLVPMAWPLVVLVVVLIFKTQLAAGVASISAALSEFIASRLSKFAVGKVVVEGLPPVQVRERTIDEPPPT